MIVSKHKKFSWEESATRKERYKLQKLNTLFELRGKGGGVE